MRLDYYSFGCKNIEQLAKKIFSQTWDKRKIAERLGTKEDAIQSACTILLEIESGERVLRADANLFVYVAGALRGEAQRNWQFVLEKQDIFDFDGEEEDGEDAGADANLNAQSDEADDHSYDINALNLSAFEKLLLMQHDQSNELQEFFGLSKRSIEYQRSILFAKLIKIYDLPADFFVGCKGCNYYKFKSPARAFAGAE